MERIERIVQTPFVSEVGNFVGKLGKYNFSESDQVFFECDGFRVFIGKSMDRAK